jgi:hypothetical protein
MVTQETQLYSTKRSLFIRTGVLGSYRQVDRDGKPNAADGGFCGFELAFDTHPNNRERPTNPGTEIGFSINGNGNVKFNDWHEFGTDWAENKPSGTGWSERNVALETGTPDFS